jgi:hypothetical protein
MSPGISREGQTRIKRLGPTVLSADMRDEVELFFVTAAQRHTCSPALGPEAKAR